MPVIKPEDRIKSNNVNGANVENYTCPINYRFMIGSDHPVKIRYASGDLSNHVYSHSAISTSLANDLRDPMTRNPVPADYQLIRQGDLENEIHTYLQQTGCCSLETFLTTIQSGTVAQFEALQFPVDYLTQTVRVGDENQTLLQVVAAANNISMVKALLAAGYDFSHEKQLAWSEYKDKFLIFLVDEGLFEFNQKDKNDKYLIDYVFAHGSDELIDGIGKILIQCQILNIKNVINYIDLEKYHPKSFDRLLKRMVHREITDDNGNTMLHWAVKTADYAWVERLWHAGGNILQKNADNKSPLDLIGLSGDRAPFTEVIKHLFANNYLFPEIDEAGNTFLFHLIRNPSLPASYLEYIAWLCDRGLYCQNVDKNGNSLIHAVIMQFSLEKFEIMNSLMRAGVSLDVQNKQGETALHLAVKDKNYATAAWLIEQGADLTLKDKNGQTAFEYTVDGGKGLFLWVVAQKKHDSDRVLIRLVEAGAYDLLTLDCKKGVLGLDLVPNNRTAVVQTICQQERPEINASAGLDGSGNRLIHAAAKKNNLPMIMALLSAGADPTKGNNAGLEAYELCTDPKTKQILQTFTQLYSANKEVEDHLDLWAASFPQDNNVINKLREAVRQFIQDILTHGEDYTSKEALMTAFSHQLTGIKLKQFATQEQLARLKSGFLYVFVYTAVCMAFISILVGIGSHEDKKSFFEELGNLFSDSIFNKISISSYSAVTTWLMLFKQGSAISHLSKHWQDFTPAVETMLEKAETYVQSLPLYRKQITAAVNTHQRESDLENQPLLENNRTLRLC